MSQTESPIRPESTSHACASRGIEEGQGRPVQTRNTAVKQRAAVAFLARLTPAGATRPRIFRNTMPAPAHRPLLASAASSPA